MWLGLINRNIFFFLFSPLLHIVILPALPLCLVACYVVPLSPSHHGSIYPAGVSHFLYTSESPLDKRFHPSSRVLSRNVTSPRPFVRYNSCHYISHLNSSPNILVSEHIQQSHYHRESLYCWLAYSYFIRWFSSNWHSLYSVNMDSSRYLRCSIFIRWLRYIYTYIFLLFRLVLHQKIWVIQLESWFWCSWDSLPNHFSPIFFLNLVTLVYLIYATAHQHYVVCEANMIEISAVDIYTHKISIKKGTLYLLHFSIRNLMFCICSIMLKPFRNLACSACW